MRRLLGRFVLVVTITGLLPVCVVEHHVAQADPPALINIDGSSTVYPLTEAIAEGFQQASRWRVQVTVGLAGTGGGFTRFCRGEIDIVDASRPILKDEMDVCRKHGIAYYELPVAFDAITVVVSPKNTWATSMTVEELKRIWEPAAQKKITKWSEVRYDWPDAPLVLFGAGSDSGTFDYFTDAIVGRSQASRGDYTVSDDHNVLAQRIEDNKNALGYLPLAYYAAQRKKLKVVSIVGKNGPVFPNAENVVNGSYQPLARPLFIYVSESASKRTEVQDFVDYYLTEGPTRIAALQYVPLHAHAYGMARARFQNGVLGTGFGGGSEIGLAVEAVMNRPPKR